MEVFSRSLMIVVGRGRALGDTEPFEKPDSIEEAATTSEHREINGVEVPLTSEAAGEVGLRIRCSMEVVADRTEESEIAVSHLRGDAQSVDDPLANLDLVSKASQVIA